MAAPGVFPIVDVQSTDIGHLTVLRSLTIMSVMVYNNLIYIANTTVLNGTKDFIMMKKCECHLKCTSETSSPGSLINKQ